MTAVQVEKQIAPEQLTTDVIEDDPFGLDITFIEGTLATESVLMCTTGDNCGTSCPSACANSGS
ncbi:FxLD family lanthipeptide [Streptomyces cellulosae]